MNEAKVAQYLYISTIDYFFLFFFLNTYIKMFQIKALQISRERATFTCLVSILMLNTISTLDLGNHLTLISV